MTSFNLSLKTLRHRQFATYYLPRVQIQGGKRKQEHQFIRLLFSCLIDERSWRKRFGSSPTDLLHSIKSGFELFAMGLS
jgi:hypothetical protein